MRHSDDRHTFVRLSDGTALMRWADGSFRPVVSETDRAGVAAMTEEDIERHAANDPDHPGLDEAFWSGVDEKGSPETRKEMLPLEIDVDVLEFFRRGGSGYAARINAILRRYAQAVGKRG